jgi:inward rectifier potassium channel
MAKPSAPQVTERMLDPQGRLNIARTGVRDGFLGDMYLFLLASSWPRLVVLLATAYLVANSLFAIAYLLEGHSLEHASAGSFSDAFFFSVQTMATIGYGYIIPRTLFANILVTVESLTGLFGLAVVTGLVFAKFSRPTARVLFSRVAVVTPRDGVPSLMFRMANQRGNQIVEARIHVVLALTETTAEGEVIRRLQDLEMARAQNALFALSWTAVHPITATSPFYRRTHESLAATETEVIVSLTGIDESFSQTVHARHSYTADEIVWGARFVDILSRAPDGRRCVDYTHFHEVVADDASVPRPAQLR